MPKKINKIGILFLFPCLLIVIFTILLPILVTFKYSLNNFKLTEPENNSFIGLQNYYKVFTSDYFYSALKNSLIILFVVVIIGTLFSLIIAITLNKKTVISPFLTAVIIIPWALPPIVNGIMWKFIFSPNYGLVNKILLKLGIINTSIDWTNNKFIFLIIVSLIIIWRVVPFSSVVFLANLQNIPESYYESIYLEGSSNFQAFTNITLPLLAPSFGVVLMNLTTTAINVFDEIISLSGYKFENQTLLVYNYLNTFNFLDFGLGSSISYIIMIITGVFGYFYIKNMRIKNNF